MFYRNSTKGTFSQKVIQSLEISAALSFSDFEVIAFIVSGHGKIYLKINDEEVVNFLYQSLSFYIPKGSSIQIKNLQEIPLELSLFSMSLSEHIVLNEVRTLCDNWAIKDNPTLSYLFKPFDYDRADYIAPDGSHCRLLVKGTQGDLAHFTQNPGQVSVAIKHQIIDEIWQIQSGQGEMWMKDANNEEVIFSLEPGIVFSIIENTAFQFRNTGDIPLTFIAVTMPRWPGNHIIDYVEGHWTAMPTITKDSSIVNNQPAITCTLNQPASMFSAITADPKSNLLDSFAYGSK